MDRSGNRVGYPYQIRNPYTAEPTSKPTNVYGNPSNNDKYNSGGNPYNPYNPGSNGNNAGGKQNIPEVNPFSQEPVKTSSEPDTEEEKFKYLLLKPQPKVLGTVQIFIAFMHLVLGTVIICSEKVRNFSNITLAGTIYVNFWSIPFFLVSGSLSISVEVKKSPSKHLVKAYFAMNILSSIKSLAGLGLSGYDVYNSSTYDDLTALMVFSAIINLLEFCVTWSLTHFARLAVELKYGHQVSTGIIRTIDFTKAASTIGDIVKNAEGLTSMVDPDTIEGITSIVGDPSAFIPED